jgi:Fe-S-cluster containining protein
MPNPRKQDRELDALYAQLPVMHCRGYCHDSCGPIGMSVRERARIIERARKPITCGEYATCSMLTPERKCGVYDIRPMICRLWGLVKGMPCPYGCRPEGGLMEDEEAVKLLLAADEIGGPEQGEALLKLAQETLAALNETELHRRAQLIMGHHRPSVKGRDGALAPTVVEVERQGEIPLGGGRLARRQPLKGQS